MKLKISRLFHWLYATLMFLPILMFLPACLYFAFNEHATNETTTEINYKYQSNEVNTLDDLVEGNIYHLDMFYPLNGNMQNGQYYQFEILNINEYPDYLMDYILDDFDLSTLNIKDASFLFNVSFNDGSYNLDCSVHLGNTYFIIVFDSIDDDIYLYLYDFDFRITYNLEIFKNEIEFLRSDYEEYDFTITESDYNVIESVTTNVEQTIPQQINNAWNSVWNLPVFSWTQNSFITAPFSYITALFGLSSNNTLNYVFTYFASISICWLVFDLIMYVPNLAHRWLDRSAIE